MINEEGDSGMKGFITGFQGSLTSVGFFHLILDGNKAFMDGVEYFFQIFCLGFGRHGRSIKTPICLAFDTTILREEN